MDINEKSALFPLISMNYSLSDQGKYHKMSHLIMLKEVKTILASTL